MFEKENYSEEEQMDLYQGAPSLSLRFAMPPIAQVRVFSSSFITFEALRTFREVIWKSADNLAKLAFSLAPSSNRRSRQPQLPYQNRSRHDDISIPIPGWYYRSYRFSSHGW
jgi:hypothetical protein